jgi:hypothetical protein
MTQLIGNPILMPEVVREQVTFELPAEYSFGDETILPMELIRTHCKVDDNPAVTNEQLSLYRKSSLESAEQYTSFFLSGTKRIAELVKPPKSRRNPSFFIPRDVKHQVKFQLADERVFVETLQTKYMMNVPLNTRIITVPVQLSMFADCCKEDTLDHGTRITYLAGFRDPSKIPGGVILGCLKFIAWSVNNPGDVLMTVRNTQKSNNATIIGTNNVAWSSGALELWRQYSRDDF